MPAPSLAPATEKWMTKAEASALLKLSSREIERMAQRGRIGKRYEHPGDGRRYGRTLYVEADILALHQERESGVRRSAVLPVPQQPAASVQTALVTSQAAASTAQADAWGALALHLTKLSDAYPPRLHTRAWLTFGEAVEYSGIMAAELNRLLREGLVYSQGRGPKTWRIQRASLDAYGEAPHQ